jgi:DNA-binding transcriptional regulator YbjK
MNPGSQHESKRYRRSILAMAAIAVAAYVFAFTQADRGNVYYQQYAQAFTDCHLQLLEAGAMQTNCDDVAQVRYYLRAHREAFAVGEPFLNLALSLTLAVLLSPLLRKLSQLLIGQMYLSRRQATNPGS